MHKVFVLKHLVRKQSWKLSPSEAIISVFDVLVESSGVEEGSRAHPVAGGLRRR